MLNMPLCIVHTTVIILESTSEEKLKNKTPFYSGHLQLSCESGYFTSANKYTNGTYMKNTFHFYPKFFMFQVRKKNIKKLSYRDNCDSYDEWMFVL